MGMFDSVHVRCPGCSQKVELQSKAGECLMREFSIYNAPVQILLDLQNQLHHCECGQSFRLIVQVMHSVNVEPV